MHKIVTVFPYAVAVLILAVLSCILFKNPDPIVLDDALRHFAAGSALRSGGASAIGWGQFLPFTVLASARIDPWFGADLVFALLSSFELVTAIKIFTIVSIACVLSALLVSFHWLRISPWIQSVLLLALIFCEPMVFFRLLLGRPFVLLMALTILCVGALLTKRTWILLPAIALAFFTSQLAIFPLTIVTLGIVWMLMTNNSALAKRTALMTALGALLGLILMPNPLAYVEYLVTVFLRIPFLGLPLGGEMQPGFSMSLVLLIALAALAILQFPLWRTLSSPKMSHPLFFLNTLCVIFFLFFLKWNRAADVLWPVMILSFAVALEIALRQPREKRFFAILLLAIGTVASASYAFIGYRELSVPVPEQSLQPYRESAAAIPQNSTVLNPDWDDFAPFIALRPDLQFVMGIDPSFTYVADPEGYRLLHKPFALGTTFDMKVWLQELLKHYPSDVLILERSRHPSLITALSSAMKLKDLAEGKGVSAVFDVKSLRKE